VGAAPTVHGSTGASVGGLHTCPIYASSSGILDEKWLTLKILTAIGARIFSTDADTDG
jgi:hypothetical protein